MGQLDEGLRWGHEFSHCPGTSQSYFFLSSKQHRLKHLFLLFEMETSFVCVRNQYGINLYIRAVEYVIHHCYSNFVRFWRYLCSKNTADFWTVSLLIDKLSVVVSQIQHTSKQNNDTTPKTFKSIYRFKEKF